MRQLWCFLTVTLVAVGGVYAQIPDCTNGECSESEIVLNQSTVFVSHEAGNAQFSVSFSNPECTYIVRNLVPWIQSVNGNAGESFFNCTPASGNTITFDIAVSENPDLAERVGLLRIGGQSVTVRQAARPCEYTFTTPPLTVDVGDEGTTGTLEATSSAGCTADFDIVYNDGSNGNWLSFVVLNIDEPGDAPTVYQLEYTVALSEDAFGRSAVIRMLDGPGGNPTGAVYAITQEAAICQFTFNTNEFTFDAEGGTGAVTIDTESGCRWDLTGIPEWLTISQTAGTEVANLSFTVEPANDRETLTATISVLGPPDSEGDSFTITRTGCSFALSRTDASYDSAGGPGSFEVITQSACDYTIGGITPWVSTEPGPFQGPREVLYTVAANTSTEQRIAKLDVGGAFHNITQEGCNYEVSPTVMEFNGEGQGDIDTIEVETGDACTWQVITDVDWIIPNIDEQRRGSGNFRISLLPNRGNSVRVGLVSIGNQSVQVRQGTGSVFVFEREQYRAWEREEAIEVSLLRTGLDNEAVSVSLRLEAESAVEGEDFPAFSTRITFPAGSARETVSVPILDDGLPEDVETLRAVLFDPDDNATLGALIETELEILDLQAPTITDVYFEHAFYGIRREGAHFAQGDETAVYVAGEDADNDPSTTLDRFVNNAQLGDGPTLIATQTPGERTLEVQVRDVEGNTADQGINYRVVPRPQPPDLTDTPWNARRGEAFTADLDDTYFYDFNELGHVGQFGAAPVPLVFNQGRYAVDVYRIAGDPDRPETLVVSTPQVVQLTITDNPDDSLRFKSMVPWFSHRLGEGSLDDGDFAFTSVLAVTNTGGDAAQVRISVRRSGVGANDRSAMRRATRVTLAPGEQLVLDADSPDFISDLVNDHFNQEAVWSADGDGIALLIESDSSYVTAGYATYSGSNDDKSSTASPARAELYDLDAASNTLVYNNLPGGGDDSAALVVVNTGNVPTRLRLEFFDQDGAFSSRETAEITPWAPLALSLTAADLTRSGFAKVTALNDQATLVGSAFFFNARREPAMALAEPLPERNGAARFFLPWVSYNLNGGSGFDGDYAFRSRLVVNNFDATRNVTLTFTARRGGGDSFTAERTLGPSRQAVYDVADLFGLDSGSGMAVTVEADHGLVGVNVATLGGRRNLPDKEVAASPSQANAATFLDAGRELVFGLVNDGRRPQIVPAAIIMNLGDQPEAPVVRAFNESGILHEMQLDQPIPPGAPYVLLLNENGGEGIPGQLGYLPVSRTQDVSLTVSGSQLMTGALFLNAPDELETAMALAPSTTKVKRAAFAKENRLIEGDPFDLQVNCQPCDALQFTINGQVKSVEISENGTYNLLSEEFNLTDRSGDTRGTSEPGTYDIEIRPVLDGQVLNEATLIAVNVDIRLFFPDTNFYQALGGPTNRGDLLSIFLVQIEDQPVDLTGINELTNLFSLDLKRITRAGDRSLDLDFSQFGILHEVLLDLGDNPEDRTAGIRSMILPQQQLLREVFVKGADDLEFIRFGEPIGNDRLIDDFEAVKVEQSPSFQFLDLSLAEFAATPLISGTQCPQFHCLAMPEVRTTDIGGVAEPVTLFIDLQDSGFQRLDNDGCGLSNSILETGIANDFVIVNTLQDEGCSQVDNLLERDIFIFQNEDSVCLD